jgi:hypothetical protein
VELCRAKAVFCANEDVGRRGLTGMSTSGAVLNAADRIARYQECLEDALLNQRGLTSRDTVFIHFAQASQRNLIVFSKRRIIRDAQELGEHPGTNLIDKRVLRRGQLVASQTMRCPPAVVAKRAGWVQIPVP